MQHSMIKILFALLLAIQVATTEAATLHVGSGQQYATLSPAANAAQPGDTILIHAGTYTGGLSIINLKGLPTAWITIRNAPNEEAIFEGGTNAIQFVEPTYLHLKGLVFQHQTGNGVNTDDGGTYDTPAHHVIFEQCTFREMSATGNNDLLKLSGLDHFEVRNCTFLNGSPGGSGIDMVGCHFGIIKGNSFEEMGTNSIQCKGGSEHVRIEGNFFKNGGNRSLNLGGSTGLAFFRPDTAHFEAANLQVYSNIFIGSEAPIAFVGAVGVKVVNNTIYRPKKWVVRILQETVDPTRFFACGDNEFRNNLVFVDNNLATATNIGPNTSPESFRYSNNLWFHADNANWAGPYLPVVDSNQILNLNPLLVQPDSENFSLQQGSPAIGMGQVLVEPTLDYLLQLFAAPPTIGAIEANPVSSIFAPSQIEIVCLSIFPNPIKDILQVQYDLPLQGRVVLTLSSFSGAVVANFESIQSSGAHLQTWQLPNLPAGLYAVQLRLEGQLLGVGTTVVGY